MAAIANVTCPCGMQVDLHECNDLYPYGPWWDVWDPDDVPDPLPPDEGQRKRAAAYRYDPIIACLCGRRYEAWFDPPAVTGVGRPGWLARWLRTKVRDRVDRARNRPTERW